MQRIIELFLYTFFIISKQEDHLVTSISFSLALTQSFGMQLMTLPAATRTSELAV